MRRWFAVSCRNSALHSIQVTLSSPNGRERICGNRFLRSLKSRLCPQDRSPLLFGKSHFVKRVIDSYQRLLDVLGRHFAHGSLSANDFDR